MSAPADDGRRGHAAAAVLAGEDDRPETDRTAGPAVPVGGGEVPA